jgi:hypothetical protein
MFRRGSTLRYKEPKSEVVVVGNLAWGLRSFVNFAKLKERAKEMVVWLRQFCFAKAINFLLIRKRLVTTLKSLLFHPTSFTTRGKRNSCAYSKAFCWTSFSTSVNCKSRRNGSSQWKVTLSVACGSVIVVIFLFFELLSVLPG